MQYTQRSGCYERVSKMLWLIKVVLNVIEILVNTHTHVISMVGKVTFSLLQNNDIIVKLEFYRK